MICGIEPSTRKYWSANFEPEMRILRPWKSGGLISRSEEHTSELQSHHDLVCRLLLEKKNSTSDAFIAANFLAFPVTAKLAFMVFGPMMDMKLLLMYGLVFKKRFTLSFSVVLFIFIGL